MTFKPSLLLQVSHPTDQLLKLKPLLDEFDVTFLFYQPSPFTTETLASDEAGVRRAAELLKTTVIDDPVASPSLDHHHEWHDGMALCRSCYREAIHRVASVAEHGGFDFYTSLLYASAPELNREEEDHTGTGTTQYLSLAGRL